VSYFSIYQAEIAISLWMKSYRNLFLSIREKSLEVESSSTLNGICVTCMTITEDNAVGAVCLNGGGAAAGAMAPPYFTSWRRVAVAILL